MTKCPIITEEPLGTTHQDQNHFHEDKVSYEDMKRALIHTTITGIQSAIMAGPSRQDLSSHP